MPAFSPRPSGTGRSRPGAVPTLIGAILLIAAAGLAAQHLFVQVRDTRLRTGPSYLAAATASVAHGARLTVIGERGPWREVTTDGGERGWLHASALGRDRVRLQGGEQDAEVGADAEEIALAGKGFTEEVEREYRQGRRDVDYAWVDRMATWRVSPEEALAFLRDGGVTPPTGGAR